MNKYSVYAYTFGPLSEPPRWYHMRRYPDALYKINVRLKFVGIIWC